MSDRTRESVSISLEAEISQLPYMPYLLQDLWALGGSVELIIDAQISLDLPPAVTKGLDLGCGKGAVSVQAAARCGFRMVGLDAMAPFLKVAREKAAAFGVSRLCRFRKRDLIKYVGRNHRYDLVILASLGGILGNFSRTVSRMRAQVRPGGYLLIDDGYLKKKNRLKRKGYEHYRNHRETIKELTSYQDQLIQEVITTAMSREINEEYLKVIRKRSQELINRRPSLEKKLSSYIELQEEECRVLDRDVEGALWVLQKN